MRPLTRCTKLRPRLCRWSAEPDDRRRKIGQLHQYFNFKDFDTDLIRQGRAGSVINAAGALGGQGNRSRPAPRPATTSSAWRKNRGLKIPQLFGRDVIHGYRTVFPINLGQAAAWDPDLAEQAAAVAAREASADGIKWTFAPMVDIGPRRALGPHRRGRRRGPVPGAAMARAVVRGFQGDDFAQPDRLVACVKHFVGYGLAEGGRDYDGGELSDATLRDVYLPPSRRRWKLAPAH